MVQDLSWSIMKHQCIQHISAPTIESQVQNNHGLSTYSSPHSDLVRGHMGDHTGNYMCLLLGNFVTIPLWPSDPAKSGVTVPVSHSYVCVRMCVLSETMVRLPHSNWEQLWFFTVVWTSVCVCVCTQFCVCVCVYVRVKPPSLLIYAHTHNNIIWHAVTSTAW